MLTLLFVLASAQPTRTTPGFAYLGTGYDILEGNPYATTGLGDPGFRAPLFEFTYKRGRVTQDQKYKVADRTNARTFFVCSSSTNVNVFNSAFSYYQLQKTSVDITGGFKGSSFSFGVDSQKIRNSTDQRREVYLNLEALCTRYQLQLNRFAQPDVSEDWIGAIDFLPEEYHAEDYYAVIEAFGTHYIQQMNVGGRWGRRAQFTSRNYQALLDDKVDVNFGIKAAIDNGPTLGFNLTSTTRDTTAFKVMQATSNLESYSIGGVYDKDPKIWMENIAQNPLPVHMSLQPLSGLITKRRLKDFDEKSLVAKKANFEKAVDEYCAYKQAQTPGFSCAPPKPIPFPMPMELTDEVRRVCVKNSGAYAMYWTLTRQRVVGINVESETGGGQNGGTCLCPNGQTYQVGDNNDNCASLACKGGKMLSCTANAGLSSTRGVTCATGVRKLNNGGTSETYPNAKDRCFDGSQAGFQRNDIMGGRACAIAGRCNDLPHDKLFRYNERSLLQANYECYGSTLSIYCQFTGLVSVGQNGQGGRRLEASKTPIKERLLSAKLRIQATRLELGM